MSTTARWYWLRLLRQLGIRNFRATSDLGLPYICHVGDFSGEVPFYGRSHSVAEISVMTEWCRGDAEPVVFDIGANNGFVATQLAQAINNPLAKVYAFEPIPSTFEQMKLAVHALDLERVVVPICCAVSDSSGIVSLAYNPHESLYAQVRNDGLNKRAGTEKATAAAVTLDEVVGSTGLIPTLLKIDVEGFESRVLMGAKNLLSGKSKPAICFEWNPLTSGEVGTGLITMRNLLAGYHVYYIDDFKGQKRPFGEPIENFDRLDHICNLFGVPASGRGGRWDTVRDGARQRIGRV